MVLKNFVGNVTDTAKTKEVVVTNHVGIKSVGHHDFVPIGSGIAIFHQPLNLIGMKMPPTPSWFFDLLVTIEILIVSIVEVFLVDEVFVDSIVG
jgi:hypothetical protein